MRLSIIHVVFLMFNMSVMVYGQTDSINGLQFINKTEKLGVMPLKDKRSVTFKAVSMAEKPFVITGADVACGCTKVSYSKKPIMPRDTVLISVTFDAKDKGAFYKKIVIKNSYTPLSDEVAITGVVE